jgi:hypothetical protein
MKRGAFTVFALAVLLSAVDARESLGPAPSVDPAADLPDKIIERVIKIEGSVEKPRVIFIVPRAKLWKDDFLKKSFLPDILKPVYPEPSQR